MTIRPSLLALIAACLCAAVLALTTTRFANASRSHAAAQARLATLVSDAQDLMSLRARAETVALGQRPAQDTIAQVTDALTRAGLPSERLKDLAQQSDAALAQQSGGPPYRAQTVRFSLEPLTARELGEFLVAWRSGQLVWSVTQIELIHAGGEDDAQYRAVIHISAVYLEGPAPTQAAASIQAPNNDPDRESN